MLGELDWFTVRTSMHLVGVGGTIRNIANIDQKAQNYPLALLHGYQLSYDRVEAICDELRRRTVKERAEVPGLNDERADVVLAGAVVLRQMMRHSNAKSLQVSGQGLREGVFYEHFLPGLQPPVIPNLRVFAVENLARTYHYQHIHVAKVRDLALQLFDQLQRLHGYGPWERELLAAAATLHDIGVEVNYYDHHKHSAYIILNSAMPGYSHRKGAVDVREWRGVLADDDEQRVARLAAVLRIAEHLDRSKCQVVSAVTCTIGDHVRIAVQAVGDATLEVWEANRRTALFRKAFGQTVVIEVQSNPG
jgi:exopolyphosphatase/guanosine-5'-triphosphate,3'-diphosphate pyrophosphatase